MSIRRLLESFGWGIFMLFMMGGILLYQGAPLMLTSFKPAVSFEDLLDGKEIKAGSHVEGNVAYVLGDFASESTYTKRQDGSRSGDRKNGKYYLIPTANGFVGLKGRQADVEVLDQLSDETYEYLQYGTEPTTQFFLEGNVEVMEDKLAKFYRECLSDMGYTEEEIEDMGTPLVIQFKSFQAVRILFVLGILMVAAGILIWWRGYHYESGLGKAEDLPNSPV